MKREYRLASVATSGQTQNLVMSLIFTNSGTTIMVAYRQTEDLETTSMVASEQTGKSGRTSVVASGQKEDLEMTSMVASGHRKFRNKYLHYTSGRAVRGPNTHYGHCLNRENNYW